MIYIIDLWLYNFKYGEKEEIMKKLIIVLCMCICISVLTLTPLSAYNNDILYNKDNFSYSIIDEEKKEINIKDYFGNEKNLIVPETIDGYKVVQVSGLQSYGSFNSIYIPKTVRLLCITNKYNLDKLYENVNEFIVDPANQNYSSENGTLYSKDKTILYHYPPNKIKLELSSNVKKIESYAFKKTAIENLVIPEGVEEIADLAFYWSETVKSITLPSSIATIGDSLFMDCNKLEKVILPETIISINDFMFHHCISLKSINIPRDCIKVASSAFDGCERLEKITISPGNKNFIVENNVLYDYNKTSLIKYAPKAPGDKLVIADSVKRIENNAVIYATNLKEVVLPNGLQTIGFYAFFRCENLETVNLPAGIDTLNEDYKDQYFQAGNGFAFSRCRKLKNIDIKDNDNYVIKNGCLYTKDYKKLVLLVDYSLDEIIVDQRTELINTQFLSDLTGNQHRCNIFLFDKIASIGQLYIYSGEVGNIEVRDEEILDLSMVNFYSNDIETIVNELNYLKQYYGANYYIVDNTINLDNNVIFSPGTSTNINKTVQVVVNEIVNGNEYNELNNKLKSEFKLYDINLMKNDQKIQPDGTCIVKIPVPISMKQEKCKVYYYDEEKNLIDVEAVASDGYMVFPTNHFGSYVLTEDTRLLGDLNGDETIDYRDAVLLLQADSGAVNLTSLQKEVADFNKDGKIDYNDAVMILKYDTGMSN